MYLATVMDRHLEDSATMNIYVRGNARGKHLISKPWRKIGYVVVAIGNRGWMRANSVSNLSTLNGSSNSGIQDIVG